MLQNPTDISRSDTINLHFAKGEVLTNLSDQRKRSMAIHKATYFGNLRHQKVAILFHTGAEVFRLHTTIWLHYKKEIYLKGNIRLPVERILSIEF